MRIRQLFAIAFFVMIAVAVQAQPAKIIVDDLGEAQPWNHLNVNNGEEQFQFVVVTDRTGGHRPGIFMDGVNKLNLLQPEFVMSVGDLIEGYTEDVDEINRQWDEFDGFIEQLQVPFFYVAGNHDYTNPVMADIWKKRLGPTYYHFKYKDVLFLCLNSEEDKANEGGQFTKILDKQFDYAQKVLEENQDVKWTLVFIHKPMWVYDNTGKWEELDEILGERPHTVFAGHQHHYVKYERNNGKYFMLATTGGGSGLRGPALGEFDHVVWITMTDEGPIMANLMLDGIWSEDVVTEKQWELVSQVRRVSPMRITPVIVTDTEFNNGMTEVRLTNDSDVPMHVSLRFENYLQLRPGFEQMEKEVAPNSVEIVELPIMTTQVTDVNEINPMAIKGTFTYKGENIPEIELNAKTMFRPIKPMPVPMTAEEVVVDGNISEWGELGHKVGENHIEATPFTHTGTEDASIAFDVKYDDTYMYVGVHVQDDELLTDEGKSQWQQDALMIQVHGGPANMSATSTSMWDGVGILQNPSESDGMERVYRADRIPAGVKSVCKPVEDGFAAEVAIPIALMDSLQGGSWEYARINVGMLDFDMEYKHESRILWQPSWESEKNYIGSGLFIKDEAMKEKASGKK